MTTSVTIGDLIFERADQVAAAVVDRQYALEPDVWARYGARGREKSVRDARWHLRVLSEAVCLGCPDLFVRHVDWTAGVLSVVGLPATALTVCLDLIRDELRSVLDGGADGLVDACLEPAFAAARDPATAASSHIGQDGPQAELTRAYLQAVLDWRGEDAAGVIRSAVDAGLDLTSLYLDVLEPAQKEVGRLWQIGRATVAQEHYCSAVTQRVMAGLYSRVFARPAGTRRMVAASVSGELHEMGLRMVADLLQLNGWTTDYLGANLPAAAVVATARETGAQLLCLSAALSDSLRAIRHLIAGIRAETELAGLPIAVGGYPFNLIPGLWCLVGADGSAPDGRQAVALAEALAARTS